MPPKSSNTYSVKVTERFEKDLKLILKRYPGFKENISHLVNELSKSPSLGIHLGHGIYKVRVEIKGKSSGKRYGARVIYIVFVAVSTVYLIRVYDKSDKKDLSREEMKVLIAYAKEIKGQFE